MKALVVTSLFFSSTWLSPTLLLTCLQPNWLIAAAVSTVLGYLRHCHAKDHFKRLKNFPAIKMFVFVLSIHGASHPIFQQDICKLTALDLNSWFFFIFLLKMSLLLPFQEVVAFKTDLISAAGDAGRLTCRRPRCRRWPRSQETPWQPGRGRCSRGRWVCPRCGRPAARPSPHHWPCSPSPALPMSRGSLLPRNHLQDTGKANSQTKEEKKDLRLFKVNTLRFEEPGESRTEQKGLLTVKVKIG